MQKTKLILASSSVYRQTLLTKLKLPFKAESPNIDESLLPNEKPVEAAVRLATAKAMSLSNKYPGHFIIGSDQIAMLQGKQLTKPGNKTTTIAQLRASSGRKIEFFTGLCLLNSSTGDLITEFDTATVLFKKLSLPQIEKYVGLEKPYDCAGGFMAEGLGIALFERIESNDPNTLVGLPLIKLVKLLSQFGLKAI